MTSNALARNGAQPAIQIDDLGVDRDGTTIDSALALAAENNAMLVRLGRWISQWSSCYCDSPKPL